MSNGPDVEALIERFLNYAAGFKNGDADHDYHIRLKAEHSLRVLELARTIAREERLESGTARLLEIAALFHDAGRFEQFARHHTFNDRQSCNHARMGITVLLRDGLLGGLDPATRRVALGAVFLHNVRALPPRLPEPLGAVTRGVRDADKLDIYPVMLSHLDGDKPLDPVVCLGVARDPDRYSEAIIGQLERGRLANYADMRFSNDFRLLLLGWVFDLNYATARRILDQSGHLSRIFGELPRDERMLTLRKRIEEQVRRP
ncbi:MAG: HD domain-containing protein [Desulfovibrionaceae bacterium]|uniref:HD domain-containing protein n=1 Tax=Desulfovibrio aminophilus TaxID=81425 RepID=UPI000414540D|nr:HD domain-containing protein [Desulfovibrio aminophilus]MDY0306928.1 HD domain-containing protein [Desulfovibrionaceae bacterium]